MNTSHPKFDDFTNWLIASLDRIDRVVDDDIGTATFFHEALRQNIVV